MFMLRQCCVIVIGLLLVSCAYETPREQERSAEPADTLARFAGTWQVSAWNAAGEPLPAHTLTATSGSEGWTQSFPERPDIPLRVIDSGGDLVVFEAGPYESVLHPGSMVTVFYVTRIEGDRSKGHLIAWFDAPDGAIPAVRGRTEGTRRK